MGIEYPLEVAQEKATHRRELEVILRALVEADLAGVVIVPHEAFDCAYCDGTGNVVQISKRQSRYTFDHKPDCPIARGREWLAKREQGE